jgi:uncharacterized SAM-binding protein YcdF (DUF218 family)
MGLTHQKWLPSICTWLDVSAEPRKADFIVYLGGEEIRRAERTAQLYNLKYAPRIIASGNYLYIQQGLEILSSRGVPLKTVIINHQATNTWDEVQQILAILRDEQANSALIVTSASHTRRASAVFEKFQTESRIAITFIASDTGSKCENWWQTPGGKYTMQYEYPRIIFYLFRYGVVPF